MGKAMESPNLCCISRAYFARYSKCNMSWTLNHRGRLDGGIGCEPAAEAGARSQASCLVRCLVRLQVLFRFCTFGVFGRCGFVCAWTTHSPTVHPGPPSLSSGFLRAARANIKTLSSARNRKRFGSILSVCLLEDLQGVSECRGSLPL